MSAGKNSNGRVMLVKEYRKEILRPKCNPSFRSVHCIAHLDREISHVLPYLNTVLGGFQYVKNPPSVTFKMHGKLITVHSQRIAINALKDEAEADKILEWLKQVINETWEKREEIKPSFQGVLKPQIFQVVKLLPKTNCGECGQSTCTLFATLVTKGAKGPEDCPTLNDKVNTNNKKRLQEYLDQFYIDP